MTIDEAINLLRSIKKEHGNLPVYQPYRDEKGGGEEELDEWNFDIREPSIGPLPLRLTIITG
jgi:hypothetical protein